MSRPQKVAAPAAAAGRSNGIKAACGAAGRGRRTAGCGGHAVGGRGQCEGVGGVDARACGVQAVPEGMGGICQGSQCNEAVYGGTRTDNTRSGQDGHGLDGAGRGSNEAGHGIGGAGRGCIQAVVQACQGGGGRDEAGSPGVREGRRSEKRRDDAHLGGTFVRACAPCRRVGGESERRSEDDETGTRHAGGKRGQVVCDRMQVGRRSTIAGFGAGRLVGECQGGESMVGRKGKARQGCGAGFGKGGESDRRPGREVGSGGRRRGARARRAGRARGRGCLEKGMAAANRVEARGR